MNNLKRKGVGIATIKVKLELNNSKTFKKRLLRYIYRKPLNTKNKDKGLDLKKLGMGMN